MKLQNIRDKEKILKVPQREKKKKESYKRSRIKMTPLSRKKKNWKPKKTRE